MNTKQLQIRLGLGALCTALLLGFYVIPHWVSSPSNIQNIVLAPTFWPYVLTLLLGLVALGLVLIGWRIPHQETDRSETVHGQTGWLRLLSLAVIMVLTMFALPRLGMVLTSVALFLTTALLFKTRHPIIAIVCAVIFPLVLYMFFAHVAGVAIPQGNFIRLP